MDNICTNRNCLSYNPLYNKNCIQYKKTIEYISECVRRAHSIPELNRKQIGKNIKYYQNSIENLKEINQTPCYLDKYSQYDVNRIVMTLELIIEKLKKELEIYDCI